MLIDKLNCYYDSCIFYSYYSYYILLQWLGPLSPKGMQLIRFMDNYELETSDEFVDSNSSLSERSAWAISGRKRANKKRLRIIKDVRLQ